MLGILDAALGIDDERRVRHAEEAGAHAAAADRDERRNLQFRPVLPSS